MHKNMTRFLDKLERFIIHFGAVLMALMAILITYQVFARYILHYAPYWTEEISCNFMMWVSLLGGACGTWTESHMDVAMLVELFPKAVQLWLRVLVDALIGFFAYFLLIDGIQLVSQTMIGTLSSLPIAIGYTYLVVPISGGLMLLFATAKAFTRIMNFYIWKEETVASEGVGAHG